MDNKDWSQEFSGFMSSALGKELVRSLKEDLHDNKVREAQKSETSDKAYGLLKEASGVMLAIDHMLFLSSIVPEKEVGKS